MTAFNFNFSSHAFLWRGCPVFCAFGFCLMYLPTCVEDLEKTGNYSKDHEKRFLSSELNYCIFFRTIKFGKSSITMYNSLLDFCSYFYFFNNPPHLWLTVAVWYFLIRFYKNKKVCLNLFLKIRVTQRCTVQAYLPSLISCSMSQMVCENMSAWEWSSD